MSLFSHSLLVLVVLLSIAYASADKTHVESLLRHSREPLSALSGRSHAARSLVATGNSSIPQTYQRFQGSFSVDVSTSLPGGGGSGGFNLDLKSSGTIAYDAQLRRVKFHFTSSSAGGFNIAEDFTNLLDYSNNLNNTWGPGLTCACATVNDEFFYLYVTPTATFIGTETITVGTASVTVQHYRDSFSAGFGDSGATSVGAAFQSDFYVDLSTSTPSMAQLIITATVGAGDQSITTTMTYQFSSVTALPVKDADVKAIFTADPSCPSCASMTPTTTATYTAPAVCPGSCLCAASYSADLTFCANIVTYPIATTTFTASTDTFVSSVYDATLLVFTSASIDVSVDCKTSYKEFLCHFYFLQCQSGGALVYPTWIDWSAKCGASAGTILASSKEATPYTGNSAAGGGSGGSSSTGQHSGTRTTAGMSVIVLVGGMILSWAIIKQ